jgi:hypothetical protein
MVTISYSYFLSSTSYLSIPRLLRSRGRHYHNAHTNATITTPQLYPRLNVTGLLFDPSSFPADTISCTTHGQYSNWSSMVTFNPALLLIFGYACKETGSDHNGIKQLFRHLRQCPIPPSASRSIIPSSICLSSTRRPASLPFRESHLTTRGVSVAI